MTDTPMSDLSTPSIAHALRFLPLGDAAVTVEFGQEIDPVVNAQVIEFADTVRTQQWDGVLDIVPTYRSLTIHFNPRRLDLDTLMGRLRRLSAPATSHVSASGREHIIPVWYGGAGGPDLEDVAAWAKRSVADVIQLHTSVLYRVYMLGFSPGFPYLGMLPEPLAMPRLATPRTTVPAGSVAIAGRQTGVYPTSTPGGWRLIGRTPITLYRPAESTPFLLNPGDTIRFVPIGPEEFYGLQGKPDDDPH